MKGIILAGGHGRRLYPVTAVISKQLLPIYDKPMIYYPLSTLMLAGVRDIALVTTPDGRPMFEKLLGDGSAWGISLRYIEQPSPRGIAEVFLLGEEFIGDDPVAIALGDNVLYGRGLGSVLRRAAQTDRGGLVFGYEVSDPERYGVVTFDDAGRPVDIVEKPVDPPSSYAVPGLYFYGPGMPERARNLKPSARGELEISDLNRMLLRDGLLSVEKLGRGVAWLDTGTPASFMAAAQFIQVIEARQGLSIGSPEEIAWRMELIGDAQLGQLAEARRDSDYGQYLLRVLRGGRDPRPPSEGGAS